MLKNRYLTPYIADFEEGLRQTISWYKNNRPLWEKQMMMRKVPVKTKDGSLVWY